MKKSLVISTIATVLVVVVALTTATFAWFSTNSISETTSEFQVASTDNAITIQRWLPADSGNNGAYENPLTATWTIGDGSAPNYEYVLTGTASVKGESATASSAYSLLAPTAKLDATNFNTASEKYGLPGVSFFSATQNGSEITDLQQNLRPVAVRFAISANSFAKTKAVASVTVSVNADAAPADFNAAQNARVYLECVPTDGASKDSQAIKVATTYKYVANPETAYTTQVEDKITSTEGGAVESGVESAQTAEGTTLVLNTTSSSLVANVDTSVIKGEVMTSATSVVFSMEQGAMYDCVLYIWIDGLTANDTAASGAFSVAVEFSGVDATPAP